MDIYQTLISVCNTVFDGEVNVSAITPEASLREDLGINSIGLLYMAMSIEETFGIKFANEDFSNIRTVADVVALIEKKQA